MPVVPTHPGKFWRWILFPVPGNRPGGSVRTKGQLTAGRGRTKDATLPGKPITQRHSGEERYVPSYMAGWWVVAGRNMRTGRIIARIMK